MNYFVSALIAAIVAFAVGLLFITTRPAVEMIAGATDSSTFTNPLYVNSSGGEFNGSLKIGPNGATFTELKAGTCNLRGMDASHAATSTKLYYCDATGVASGDVVAVQLATTSTATSFGTWIVQSAVATSSGMIEVRVYNGTGAAVVPSTIQVGSSTNYWYGDI